ncbi:MAG: hypothetical protein HY958_07825 [Bacteroidia bacterium]|nr:hypothetical protein [Bacteroidia bacterium]
MSRKKNIYGQENSQTKFLKNATLWTDTNYLDHPENIDVNWEVLIAMKLGKYLTATISTTLIYDDNTKIQIDDNEDGIIEAEGPRVQFKEIFGLGFSYKF